MSTCRLDADLLTLHAGGDLTPAEAREVEAHLATCEVCTQEHSEIAATLRALDPAALYPREAEVDWDRFAARTVARAHREAGDNVVPFRRRIAAWTRPAVLARAAAVILTIGLGALLLRAPGLRGPADDDMTSVLSEEFRSRLEVNLARAETREYLEQSRAVLLSVLEAPVRCTKDEFDVSAERDKSIRLLRRNLRLRDDLSRPELARAAELCNQVEGVLTEISTLSDCADLGRIEQLREAVHRNQLLIKMGVVESELGGSRA